jgi:hypothetical protein
MDKKYLIETTKRMRVGGTGPKRDKLKFFHKIGQVPNDILEELNQLLDEDPHNDIGGDVYGISQAIDYQKVFDTGGYRQLLIQTKPPNEEGVDVNEYLYSHWTKEVKAKKFLEQYFKTVYRFRMSEMSEQHSLNWHIDSCTSFMCRAQICLNDNDAVFEFRGRDGVHSFSMKPGELWFINTGWNHRVVNGSKPRRVAIFGYHFDDVINKEELLID